MKPKLGLISILILILGISPQLSAALGHIDSVSFDSLRYKPGDQGKCALTISDPFSDTTVKITKVELRFDFGTTIWTGELIINPGETKVLEIIFTIPESTADGDYTFSVYFEFYKREVTRSGEEKWRWVSPGSYRPSGEKIAVRKSLQVPGYPWESIFLGLSLGIAVMLISHMKRPRLLLCNYRNH